MNVIFGDKTATSYRQLRQAVEDFQKEYSVYLEPEDEDPDRRMKVLRLLPAAHAACLQSQVPVMAIQALNGNRRSGLLGLAFAHEDPNFRIVRGSADRNTQAVMDYIEMCIGALSEHERVASEREGRWGWKVEHTFRAVFAFPVRVTGIIFGFEPADLPVGKARFAAVASVVTYATPLVGGLWKWGSARGWW